MLKPITAALAAVAVIASTVAVTTPARALGGITVGVTPGTVSAGEPTTITAGIAFPEAVDDGGLFTTEVDGLVVDSSRGAPGQSRYFYTYTPQVPGTKNISVAYLTDDGNELVSSTQLVVDKSDSVVSVSAPSAARAGDTITFYSSVTSDTSVPVTGNVTYLLGDTTLGTAAVGANGQSSLTVTLPATLPQGPQRVTAQYSGDTNTAASRGVDRMNIDSATVLALTAPGTASVGQVITLTATTWPVTATGTVTFLAQGAAIDAAQPLRGGQAQVLWTPASDGSYTLTAQYSGDATNPPSTATDVVRVRAASGNDTIAATINGAPLSFTGTTLTYANTYQLSFSDQSSAPVSVSVAGACTYDNGTLTITEGNSTCTVTARTPGGGDLAANDSTWTIATDQARQSPRLVLRPRALQVGQTKIIAKAGADTTTAGQDVRYRVVKGKKRCDVTVRSNGSVKLTATKPGTCVVTAQAAALPGYYDAYTNTRTYTIKKKKNPNARTR